MAIVDCVVNKKKSLRSNKDFSDFNGIIIEASLGRFHRTGTSLRLTSLPRLRSKIFA
jgi:hypothetical protein